ncbi:peptide deformylase [Bradyrhizobium sp. STM 3557]|uniref:peptide deformylase n=1 Tax=Bradyrhizobium sp. STM 3557 TaxID=578920 RepID=UPI00388F8506
MTSIGPVDIVKAGHPVLRQRAQAVLPELRGSAVFHELIEIMSVTLEGRGVGLAAPQIGVSLRIFVMKDPKERVEMDKEAAIKERSAIPFEVVINPAWHPLDDEKVTFPEGCLSIPVLTAAVPRYRTIAAEWTAPDGAPRKQTLIGWPARIFQHEYDHLEGTLYTDYLPGRPEISYADPGQGVSDELLKRLGL